MSSGRCKIRILHPGLGVHYGIERLGAMGVPSGVGSTERQLEIMQDFGVTVLHCTPSYALYLGDGKGQRNYG